MKPRRISAVLGAAVLASTALYFFVYLWRWEWNRALIAGVLFIATEIAVAAVVVLNRLRGLEDRLAATEPAVLARIRESAPPPRDHFEWLSPKSGQLGVFVPVLIGMGVVASGLAWLVERLARVTAGPALERGLAARLGPLAWPAGGLIPDGSDDDDPLAMLDHPAPQAGRR
ncbi:MAG TPA: hypothetical protein VGV86_04890 [Acidimicrobiales bacterium]|nr:hypothetical protein [Acidimicrobiales bacterium]